MLNSLNRLPLFRSISCSALIALTLSGTTLPLPHHSAFANVNASEWSDGKRQLETIRRSGELVPTDEELSVCSQEHGGQLSSAQRRGYHLALNLYGSLVDPQKSLRGASHNLALTSENLAQQAERLRESLSKGDAQRSLYWANRCRAIIKELRDAPISTPEALVAAVDEVVKAAAEIEELGSTASSRQELKARALDYVITGNEIIKEGSKMTLTVGTGILTGGLAAGVVASTLNAADQRYQDVQAGRDTDWARLGRAAVIDGAVGVVSGGSAGAVLKAGEKTGKLLSLFGVSPGKAGLAAKGTSVIVGHEIDSVASGIGAGLQEIWENGVIDEDGNLRFGAWHEATQDGFVANHSLRALLTAGGAGAARALMLNKHLQENSAILDQDAQLKAFYEKHFALPTHVDREYAQTLQSRLDCPIDEAQLKSLKTRWQSLEPARADYEQLSPSDRETFLQSHFESQIHLSSTHSEKSSMRSQQNHWKAHEKVQEWLKADPELTLSKIQELNRIVNDGLPLSVGQPGILREQLQEVSAGGSVQRLYAPGSQVKPMMEDFIIWHQKAEKDGMPPIQLAALSYQRLLSIHPFADGNGRTSRLVMDWILQKHGLPPASLSKENLFAALFARIPGSDSPRSEKESNPTRVVTQITQAVEHSLKLIQGK